MQYRLVLAASMAIAVNASPAPAPIPTKAPSLLMARQPDSAGSSVLDAPMTIAAGESFDGGNVMYDRGVSCTGQEEGGDSDAVFILEKGATLSNVIIGPNQIEGVHCNGGCTITNVWWDKVCEDAFSIKKQDDGETTTINGGGATGADDKVIQHNGGGTVAINNFEVSDFGKMYRSCGNCKSMPARHVVVTGGSASSGKVLVGINSNMGDTASISGVTLTDVKSECTDYEGVTDGSEPSEVGPCSGTGGGSDSSATTSAAASTKTSDSTKTSAEGSTKTTAEDSTKTTTKSSTKTTKSSTKTTKSSTKTSTKKSSTKTKTSTSAKATKTAKAFQFEDIWG